MQNRICVTFVLLETFLMDFLLNKSINNLTRYVFIRDIYTLLALAESIRYGFHTGSQSVFKARVIKHLKAAMFPIS